MASALGIPAKYYDMMQKQKPNLLADNVNAWFSDKGNSYMVRTLDGLPDRLVLFFPAKTIFVELKAPGKMMRPLQRKRRYQLMKLGFPVLCIFSVLMNAILPLRQRKQK